MRTIETKVYTFDELSEQAKQKAIENHYDINMHECWHESITEEPTEVLKYFKNPIIYFSGFWRQGDGAMFVYDGITEALKNEAINSLKLPEWKKAILKAGYMYAKGKHEGHYFQEKSCGHYLDFEPDNGQQYYKNIERLYEECFLAIENFIIEKYEHLCKDLYRSLESLYNELTSGEAIIEAIEANGYEFTEDGQQI